MSVTKRNSCRFQDYARVDVGELSIFPGILENISLEGCRVRFPSHPEADTETEYTMVIHPTRKKGMQPFSLIGRPVWSVEHPDSVEIGFILLKSPGSRQLAEYIDYLETSDMAEYEEPAGRQEACVS